MTTEAVLLELNASHGTSYEVVRKLTGGLQSGAYEVVDGNQRAVLKWSDDPSWAPRVRRAAELVRQARAAGYPTPAWLTVGTTSAGLPYQLQEYVEGVAQADASRVDRTLAEELIAIVETQQGLVTDDEPTWSGWARGVTFDAWDDDLMSRVGRSDEEAAELVRRHRRLCEPYRDVELPDRDLVHGDLNVGNLLVRDGRVAAIVDIEAASGGSRAYDLVSLAAAVARDGGPAGVDELFLEAALRAGGRAATAVCATAAYVSIAEFAGRRWSEALPQIHRGGRRVLELMEAS